MITGTFGIEDRLQQQYVVLLLYCCYIVYSLDEYSLPPDGR